MNKQIMCDLGFKNQVELVEQKKCPFCHTQLKGVREEFKNEISFKEYKISGLCQKCQDEMFH